MIDVAPIRQKHVGYHSPVLVFAVSLKRDVLAKDQLRRGLLGSLPVGLPLLWAVDAVESDTFCAAVVQAFDGITVEDTDHGAGEVGSKRWGQNKDQ